MKESSKERYQSQTGSASRKINEYGPAKVPKVRMGASDVLGVVYDKLNETARTAELAAEMSGDAAARVELAARSVIEQVPRKIDIVHVFSPQDREHIESMREVVSVAAPSVSKAIEASAGKAADIISSQARSAGESLSGEVKRASNEIGRQFDGFKNWCKRWLWRFVGVCVVSVLAVVCMILLGIKSYRATSEADRLRMERDSIREREQVFRKFAEDNPKTFRNWLEKQ
jgi:hypothetical protein